MKNSGKILFLVLALVARLPAQQAFGENKSYDEKLAIVKVIQESPFSVSVVPGFTQYFYHAAESNGALGAAVSFAKPLAGLSIEAQVRMPNASPIHQGLSLGVLWASAATKPQQFDMDAGIWKSDWSGPILEIAYQIAWKRHFLKYGQSTGWTWHSLEFTFGPIVLHHLITQTASAWTALGAPLAVASNTLLSNPKAGLYAQFGARFSFGNSPWHWGFSLRAADLLAPPANETAESWRFAAEPAWHQVLLGLQFYVGVLVGAKHSTLRSGEPTL